MRDHAPPNATVTAEICIFAVAAGVLRLFLVSQASQPFQGAWALPGGVLEAHEDLDDCAQRRLRDEVGVTPTELHQFAVYSDPARYPRGRVVSVAYLALVPALGSTIAGEASAAGCDWFGMDALPTLALDHGTIVRDGTEALRKLLRETPAAFALLPPRFTLGQLQGVYEAVEGRAIDKRNFRHDIARKGWIRETGEYVRGRRRPAMLYVRAS